MKLTYNLLISLIFLVINSMAGNYTTKTKVEVQQVLLETLKNSSTGNFITFKTDKMRDEHFVELGHIPEFKRYSATFRNKSCWMIPSIGDNLNELPIETQFLLVERGNSEYIMLIPLVDRKTRSSLGGTKTGELELIGETGDSTLLVNEFLGLYMLAGTNPQAMIKQASSEIQMKLKTFKLREEKGVPWIADYFGWCTYNALYGNLNKDTLAYAMKNFQKKEIPVKYMIIDGGWQGNKNNLLDSFDGDKTKFPEGISATISMLKNEYGLEKVIMWQSLWGMFQGIDKESFADNSHIVSFLPPNRMNYLLKELNNANIENEATVGLRFYPGFIGKNITIPYNFNLYYFDYCDYLRRQGADGVKVDAMTWIEAVGNSMGGRVEAMKDMMNGLQSAINVHMNNELINCSSCSNDYLFNTLTSNLTRSSGDFFPDKKESHGFHIFTNAHTSFWMGEIVMPDWDMFQSGHKSGAFHAAARAVSGGPVYTTEVIGTEDKEVLKKLMTSAGYLPRCKDVGRVCTESLFTDPAKNKKAVKIYNTNLIGGVVGVFNCSYNPEKSVSVTEEIRATDIENRSGDEFAVYRFSTGELLLRSKTQAIPVVINELGFDLFTYVPIKNGFAPIGIVEKYNPGGMISEFNQLADDMIAIQFLEGGKFIAYSKKKPIEVLANSAPVKYRFNSHRLEIDIPEVKDVIVAIKF